VDWQLCVLHAVRDALNKVQKKDQEALKKIYPAESQAEAEETLRSLRERWETKVYALLAFLRRPKPIRRCFYITNQLEWLALPKEEVEMFCDEGAAEKLLYLALSQLNEVWGARRP